MFCVLKCTCCCPADVLPILRCKHHQHTRCQTVRQARRQTCSLAAISLPAIQGVGQARCARWPERAVCTQVLSDSQGGVGGGPHPVRGDALVLIGALLYAVVNITEEHLLSEPWFTNRQACHCVSLVS